ncbi:Pentatricopeptide repeat-containing protein [Capsicum baccatum]|uniref:Pentatricopeptide repeat-containing protein n=1 Tax=Capsicum baccatum TaxID=33114 RepID=A0A2G2VX07_CAPBA|nr:Pentatricopeptide repeat-containing protein [Capsicum baccatum]
MERRFSIAPKLEHYGCMVDLLGRAGRLQEAYNLIQIMPMRPYNVIWGTLLGACSFHGNVELAEQAVEFLSVLEPWNPGNYVILSNIYARAGMWEVLPDCKVQVTDEVLPDYKSSRVQLHLGRRTSSIRITGAESKMTISHSFSLSGTIPNISAREETYSIGLCRPNEADIETRSQEFLQGGILIKLLSLERALRELNILIATRTESDSVKAITLPTVKYSQGSEKVIRRLPALNGLTVKFAHAEPSP